MAETSPIKRTGMPDSGHRLTPFSQAVCSEPRRSHPQARPPAEPVHVVRDIWLDSRCGGPENRQDAWPSTHRLSRHRVERVCHARPPRIRNVWQADGGCLSLRSTGKLMASPLSAHFICQRSVVHLLEAGGDLQDSRPRKRGRQGQQGNRERLDKPSKVHLRPVAIHGCEACPRAGHSGCTGRSGCTARRYWKAATRGGGRGDQGCAHGHGRRRRWRGGSHGRVGFGLTNAPRTNEHK